MADSTASAYDIRYATSPITEDNFERAVPAPWKGLVIPKSAGSKENFTVKGLQPETLYYLAVKTVDYSGNASALSNGVKATTYPAPAVAIAPASLSDSLLTARQTSQSLWISNTGKGPLEFAQAASSDSVVFGQLSPASGTVAAGDSLVAKVIFDATGLLTGTYEQALKIVTNDPKHDTLTVALTLVVISNGAPIVQVKPDTVDFGQVLLGGNAQQMLMLHNAGSDTLRIEQVSSNAGDFTVTWVQALQLAPFRDTTVVVTYVPSALGSANGSLSIKTNDPMHAVLTVELVGEGIPAPGISVSPDSLYASMKSNEKKVEQLRIRNTGGSNLSFAMQSGASDKGPTTVTKINLSFPTSLPTSSATANGASQTTLLSSVERKKIGSHTFSSEVTLKSTGSSLVPLKVLILTPDLHVNDFEKVLDGFGDIQADIIPKDSLPTLTTATLAKYNVVITTNNFQWKEAGGISADKVGDALADYVDGGGKVIVSASAYYYPSLWEITGRFRQEQYGPFVGTGLGHFGYLTLGKKLLPEHPILAGVDSLFYGGYFQQVNLAPGAVALAEWSSGHLLAAAKPNVVAINLLPSLGYVEEDEDEPLWAGDVPTLYYNAIRWLVPAPFMKVSPTSGTVAPGAEFIATVELDTKGLNTGHYAAALNISSNVPGQKPITVPVTLDVAGPEFTVNPDSLSVSVGKGEKASRKLILKNNGTRTYAFTVSNQHTRLTEGPLTTSLAGASVQNTEASSLGEVISLEQLKARYGLPSSVGASAVGSSSYKTDFEDFEYGNISRQKNWVVAGEANTLGWTIDTIGNFATSGKKYVHRTSDPAGWSNLYSPIVKSGLAPKSTTRMKLNFQGEGVNWEVVFRSTTNPFVPVTVMALRPDGSLYIGVREGYQYKFVPMDETKPQGAFEMLFELDRATHVFTVYFNDRKVFSGRALDDSNVEFVSFGSGTENDRMHLYIDDVEIREGAKEEIPGYLSFSPQTDSLAPGEQTEITVDFDAAKLGFGTYRSELVVDVAGVEKLVVPTALTITGASAISLNRTVLKNTLEYKKSMESHFEISNTGGAPFTYQLDVLGGQVSIDSSATESVLGRVTASERQRLERKQTLDAQLSKPAKTNKATTLQVLTGTPLLKESFEGAFPPKGWSTDKKGWNLARAFGEGNYSGSGEAATLRIDAAKAGADQELRSPVIAVNGPKKLTLQYQVNYQDYANRDFLDLDIRVNGRESWQNVLHWNEDHGNLRGSGELVKVELEQYLQNAESFQLRWHYQATEADGWYAQLDNVEVLADAHPWLTVSPVSGTLPARGVADITTTFDAAYLEAGDFMGGIVVSSDAANAPQVGVVASLHVLKPAQVAVMPDSIYVEAYQEYYAADTITVTNTGESSWHYTFSNSSGWTGAYSLPLNTADVVEAGSSRQILVEMSTFKEPGLYYDTLYITNVDPYYPSIKVPVTLKVLPAPPQLSVIQDTIRAEVQAGQLATVPYLITNVGGSPLEVTMYKRKKTPWMTPSPREKQTIQPDDSLAFTLEFDATELTPGIYYDTLLYKTNDPRWKEGEYVAHPFKLTVLPAPAKIHLSPESIEQTVTAGQVATATLTVSNEGGSPLGFSLNSSILWLSAEPGGGYLLPDSSQTVSLQFDATSLSEGVYQDTLFIGSGDPVHPQLPVPITLTVLPASEGVHHLSLVNVRSGAEFYEIGDSLILDVANPRFYEYGIIAHTHPESVEKVAFTLDGQVTNTATQAPYALDALVLAQLTKGSYLLSAQAYAGDSLLGKAKAVVLSVFNSAMVSGMAVVNSLGESLTWLHNGDTLDISQPAYARINLKAQVSQAGVGSVKFYLNGEHFATDNIAPFSLAGDLLGYYYLPWKAKPGHYELKATPYSLPYGAGVTGSAFTVAFEVVDGLASSGGQTVGSQSTQPGQEPQLSLHPVPADRELMVRVTGGKLEGSAQVVIRNLQGQVLYQQSVPAKALRSHSVSLESLQLRPGMYSLQLIGEDGFFRAKMFIKQ